MALSLPKKILVAEVGPRDGLQSFARWVDTDIKVAIIDRLSDLGLPVSMGEIPGSLPPAEVLLEAITQDKKVKGGKLTFILTRGLGQSALSV